MRKAKKAKGRGERRTPAKPSPRAWIWSPKRLGVQQASNGPHENDVWLYLHGKTLDIVVQTNLNGVVLGTTIHKVRLPSRRPSSERGEK